MPWTSQYCSKISQRWLTVILILIALLNLYGMRVCLSISITVMALPHNNTKKFSDNTCSRNSDTKNNTDANLKESLNGNRYDWSEYTQGLILCSFYFGYMFTNFMGGIISQKIGGRRVLALSLLLSSVLTLLTPYCTIRAGSTGLMVLRLAMGVVEGAGHPATSELLSHWIPRSERSKAGSIVYSCLPLSVVYGMLPSVIILRYSDNNWPMVFYFYGSAALLSLLLIVAFCHNEPNENPFISDEELSYLKINIRNTDSKRPLPPWRHILKSLPVWTLAVASIGQSYGIATIMSDMPKYTSSVLKLSVQTNAFLSAVPYLSMWIAGGAFSWAADKLVARRAFSITAVRKIGCAISAYGFSVFIVAAVYAGCDAFLVSLLQVTSFVFLAGLFSSTMINSLDLSPNYASTITGLLNGSSTALAMFGPYVVGVLTPNQTVAEWRTVFWIIFAVMVACNTVFLIYGSAEVQAWNDPGFLAKTSAASKNYKEALDLLHADFNPPDDRKAFPRTDSPIIKATLIVGNDAVNLRV